MKQGVKLETLGWIQAEQFIASGRLVVFPLGAAAKEHGPHLPLNNDAIIANWLAEQVVLLRPVLFAPLINASFYPAFVEYPESVSLRHRPHTSSSDSTQDGYGHVPPSRVCLRRIAAGSVMCKYWRN